MLMVSNWFAKPASERTSRFNSAAFRHFKETTMEQKKNAPIFVCPECGNIFEISSKDKPCPHQKKFIKEIKSDPRFKEW
jgi:rubrerythrin